MSILKKIYPHQCILCGLPAARSQDMCADCLLELPILSHPCPQCAKPLMHAAIACGDCLKTPPPFAVTFALFSYETPITNLILNLKFQEALANARVLGELLAEKIQSSWYREKPLPDVILPVPLHPARLRERGFNQALEIARPVSRILKIPLAKNICQRIKATTAQATLHAEERQKNLRKAFMITENIQNLHIALLDDVITTGSTVSSLSQLLMEKGAKTIDVWCIARTHMG